MEVVSNSYIPGDSRLVQQIVYELKSQGIFDQFRKECISDVDTKPAYQNLRQRVEGSVTSFLSQKVWSPDMNKNHVREQLRKSIHESGYLDIGVERIVDQVVNPKINSVFLPQVEDVVYRYLGVQKPLREIKKGLKIDIEDLLPTDLEAVSPESVDSDKNDHKMEFTPDLDNSLNKQIDEDESPPFEPLDNERTVVTTQEENSVDSHLSGFSGLQSHDNSNQESDTKMCQMDISSQDSQTSQNSSESHLSIITSDGTIMEIGDDSQSKLMKHKELVSQAVISDNVPSPERVQAIDNTQFLEENRIDDKPSEQLRKSPNVKNLDNTINLSENKSDRKLCILKSDENRSEDRKSNDKKYDIKKCDKYTDERKSDQKKSEKRDDKKSRNSDKYISKDKKDDKHKKSSSRNKDREKSNSKHNSSSSKEKDSSTKESLENKDSSSSFIKDNEQSSASKDKIKDKYKKEYKSSSSSKEKGDKDRTKEKKDIDKSDKDKNKFDKPRGKSDLKDKVKSDRDKDKYDKKKDKSDKDKSKSSSSSSTKSSSSSSNKDRSSSSSKKDKYRSSSSDHKDKSRSINGDTKPNRNDMKSSSGDSKTSSTDTNSINSDSKSSEKHSHLSSSSKKSKKKDSKKQSKDDHYSSKDKKTDRRSTDRDSNDGNSNKQSNSNPCIESISSFSQKKSNDSSSISGSGTNDSGNSDRIENVKIIEDPVNNNDIQKLKYVKPKLASNFQEAIKIMKIRKQLAKLERQNQLSLARIDLVNPIPNGVDVDKSHTLDENLTISNHMYPNCSDDAYNTELMETLEVPKSLDIGNSTSSSKDVIPLRTTNLSKENFEALEARLAQEMLNVNYSSYETYDEYDCTGCEVTINPKKVVDISTSSLTMEETVSNKNIVSKLEDNLEESTGEKHDNEANDNKPYNIEVVNPEMESSEGIFDTRPNVDTNSCEELKVESNHLNIEKSEISTNSEKSNGTHPQLHETEEIGLVECIATKEQEEQTVAPISLETNQLNTDPSLDIQEMDPCVPPDSMCRYLEKPSPSVQRNLQFIFQFVKKLETDVEHCIKASQNNFLPIKRGRKRKCELYVDMKNNNKAFFKQITEVKKRGRPPGSHSNTKISKANKDKSRNSTDISPNERFSLPLSPAESDKSIGKKEDFKSVKLNTNQMKTPTPKKQRYSSEDLYKPRPVIGRGRRSRCAKNLD